MLQAYKQKIASSCISEMSASKLFKLLSAKKTKDLTLKYEIASILIQYFDLDGKPIKGIYRGRFLTPPPKGFGKKPQRYYQRKDQPPHFYLPTNILKDGKKTTWREIAHDTEISLVITEGEFKAACACDHSIPCIGLGGVWNWMSKKHKLLPINDFKKFTWAKRRVDLCFDADYLTNPEVMRALLALAHELTRLGALVYFTRLPALPEHGGKTGLDDFIHLRGSDAFVDLLDESQPFKLSQTLWELNEELVWVDSPGVVVRVENDLIMRIEKFKKRSLCQPFLSV